MARAFKTTVQYLDNISSAPDFPTTGTIAVWAMPLFRDWPDGSDHPILAIRRANPYGEFYMREVGGTKNEFWAGWYPNANFIIKIAGANWSFTSWNWHLCVCDWISEGASNFYMDGVLKGTKNPTTIFTGPSVISLGLNGYATYAAVAWPTCWNIVLSSDDRANLLAYTNPTSVQNANIAWHYALDGSDPEPEYRGGPSLEIHSNAPYWSNPPLTLPESGIAVSKVLNYAVIAPPVAVNLSKANVYVVVAPPVGVGVSKSAAYAVIVAANYANVAQVAQEIIYANTNPSVQIDQVAQEIIYANTNVPTRIAQVAQEIIYANANAPVQVAQVGQEIIYHREDKFWLAIFRLLDQ
jgi:hypothetical protein